MLDQPDSISIILTSDRAHESVEVDPQKALEVEGVSILNSIVRN